MKRYEIIPQKILLKGESYTTNQEGLVVMCTKTTCNYSSETFQGVVLESKKYPVGHTSKGWLTANFEKYDKEKHLR
jgi:hypothetical protein